MHTPTRTPITTNSLRRIRPAVIVLVLAALVGGCIPALLVGGFSGVALVANDRRASETVLVDERIERTINQRIKNELTEVARVNANVFNRTVLLSGEARTAAAKEQAEYIASKVDGVRGTHNEVEITDFRAPREQFSDGRITTQVKARMVGNGVFNPLHVQASTDGGIVYLQGLVTKAEADEASRIAASTSGVRKVVRLFEIMPDTAGQSQTR